MGAERAWGLVVVMGGYGDGVGSKESTKYVCM